MSLKVTHLSSFGAGGRPLIELTIPSSVNEYNIFTEAQNAVSPFDPASDVADGLVRVILANNVIVGSTSTATPGMTRGTGWGTGWDVEIVVKGTDSARIQGKGGKGGNGGGATGKGIDFEGGGGGSGAGTTSTTGGNGCETANNGGTGTATAGGAGGIGNTNPGNCTKTNGADGGDALEAPTMGEDIHLRPESGATLEVWSGGGGGEGGSSVAAGNGGDGGGPGLKGWTAGNGAQTHSNAGLAFAGNGTISQDGPGTIDKRG